MKHLRLRAPHHFQKTSGEMLPRDFKDTLSLIPALSRWEREKLRRPLALLEHSFANQRRRRACLSQRERAGVREKARLQPKFMAATETDVELV